MNYQQTIDFLYNATPAFEQKGAEAYKPGLERMLGMSQVLGHPHQKFRSLHIAGTNGKGSVSSTLASVFIEQGLKVGLFTSPHLVSFRERIRINGTPIEENYVVNFVEQAMPLIEKWKPSFFEITTLMAFAYFAENNVELAVIEVGMGGRLDCTNIITPLASIITNVSLDHTQFLGDTIEKIAFEKAGIIKPHVPVILGEGKTQYGAVIASVASSNNAPLFYAEDYPLEAIEATEQTLVVPHSPFGAIRTALKGEAQKYNTRTLLCTLQVIKQKSILPLTNKAVVDGFAHVVANSHLLGRWQTVALSPKVILDTGHNIAGITQNVEQLKHEAFKHLHIVFGMVADKAWEDVLNILPKANTTYYFATPTGERALKADQMHQVAQHIGLCGQAYPSISEAYLAATQKADSNDLIYVGGSNYIVSEVLKNFFASQVEQSILLS